MHLGTWLLLVAALGLVGAVAVAVWPRPAPAPAPPVPAVVLDKPVAPPLAVEPTSDKKDAPEPAPVTRAQAAGAVKVTTHPRGATLYLDGKKLEQTSNATLDGIDANREHTLVAEMSGYKEGQKSFSVGAGGTARLTVNLHRTREKRAADAAAPVAAPVAAPAPAPAASPPKAEPMEGEGTLAVASSPWCTVEIDGKDRGQTPISIKLPAGTHTVVLSNPEAKIKRSLSVVVHPGETVRKKLDFAK